ncbi:MULTISPECIES: GntR family transcriptional regulator [unclassified Aureimonas]|uniref:GntR family transcriptional regulator n=1 Tax=unclassified Aureimonas TaxID=2615206 RepID=UPI00071F7406|nr:MULTISPECIES: GntR family transcriptional regulator [unclassified Aureimonas]ALN75548.1 hypothetical protein M673_22660 [Aureimonas sp. AU20]
MKTRYAQVAHRLAGEIAEGVYPVGSTLPNEPTLAVLLGVSRSTLRAALGELQKLGLVSRRPSLGTRVEAAIPQTHERGFTQTLGSVEAIVQYASDTLRDSLTISSWVADRAAAARFEIEAGSRWLVVSFRRCQRSDPPMAPICWTDVYVAESFSEFVRQHMDGHRGTVSELVEEFAGRPVTLVEQTLKACGLPAVLAAPLEADAGDHTLEITRRYFLGESELALFSISLHPGQRFSYVSRLRRNDDTTNPVSGPAD